jgi:16S rRNA (adenine1518-N6/adenine1519-N6)-dimethyltransferase
MPETYYIGSMRREVAYAALQWSVTKSERPRRSKEQYHIGRRPPLGQVFLADRRVERRILDALELRPEDTLIEIGPGPGNMTALLAARVRSLVAIEIDARLAAALRDKFADAANVRIVEADVLQVKLDELAQPAGADPVTVYGNIPYYITSPILMHLFRYAGSIRDIVVMVQREVADRMVAAPGSPDYGLLSLTCQYYTDPQLLFTIGPKSFSPPPQVTSAIVRMRVNVKARLLGIEHDQKFWKVVRAAFAQRRKTLGNNWKTMFSESQISAALEQAGIDARVRAEALSLAQFAALFKTLRQTHSDLTTS